MNSGDGPIATVMGTLALKLLRHMFFGSCDLYNKIFV